LCSNISFKKLRKIKLNDNNLSVNGVAHIVNNRRSSDITYKLDTVNTKDKGYTFKVGEYQGHQKDAIELALITKLRISIEAGSCITPSFLSSARSSNANFA
jgi:hypothetical protein